MRDRLENIADILVPAIGLSSIWLFFRASHPPFLLHSTFNPLGLCKVATLPMLSCCFWLLRFRLLLPDGWFRH